jgi:hypothetical protein
MVDGDFELSIPTVQKFRALKQALRDADKEIRLGFLAKTRAALAPLKAAVSQSALGKLPKRGGLADRVANSKYSVRTRAASVSFITTSPLEIKTIDAGNLRHPVYGHMQAWVDQKVTPDFWTDPIEAARVETTALLETLMNQTIDKLNEE